MISERIEQFWEGPHSAHQPHKQETRESVLFWGDNITVAAALYRQVIHCCRARSETTYSLNISLQISSSPQEQVETQR